VAKKTAEIEQRKEELIRMNRNLTEVNEELDIFLYRSSHDLIAPIKSIKGLLQLLKGSKEDNEKYVCLMEDRIERLERILFEINMFVKNAKSAPAKSRFRLKDLVREVWSELEFMEEASQVNCEMHIREDLMLVCDRDRWKMVITNLLTNAIKYHDQSKPDAYIRITTREDQDGFHLLVEDNGQGIKTEYQPKVFEMFFRANENSVGTGLGLFLVKKIVDGLNGNIRVESTYRHGTVVQITLKTQTEH
jgi:signal transduction histidine kinase